MKEKKPKLNVRLLRRIQKHILAEPRRLDMKQWKTSGTAPCGTAACIAGWAVILSDGSLASNLEHYKFAKTASDFLRTEWRSWPIANHMPDDGTEAERLFLLEAWPEKYRVKYLNAATPKGAARVTANRIDHFIKTRE